MNPTSALVELLDTYHDFHSNWVERFDQPPSPVEFLQIIRRNRPVIISNGFSHWPAVEKWDPSYLKDKITEDITIAQTPFGNADSVVKNNEDGIEYFVKPHTTQGSFAELLDHLQNDTIESSDPVQYVQSQDDNLHGEYSTLLSDIDEEISWASVLGTPDAINLWIGNGRSTSALHKDNYENLYCVLSGLKSFVLISPLEVACVRERTLPSATYMADADGGFKIVPDDPPSDVSCWPTLDPDNPEKSSPFWDLCKPLRVDVHPGEILYLPAMWYHKVSQKCAPGSMCIAVNYWYDMDYSGPFYSLCQFLRSSSLLLANAHTSTY
ncbi:putative pla2g4b [Terfezia claveryi]|nr:putative pla2g4b [Terfezia claveryi]